MDKKIILSVAGSGKTTEIINNINYNDKTLIITYTENNYKNIKTKVIEKFNEVPRNIKIYKYFSFLYQFCFMPLKKGLYVKGIDFNQVNNRFLTSTKLNYYMNYSTRKMYHSRLAKLCNELLFNDIINRIEKYFDNIYIDEIQDFSGHDFNFIMNLTKCKCNVLLVGDFFQHTYDTSRDGSTNRNLYNNLENYKNKIKELSPTLIIDDINFLKSKRCSIEVCNFIKKHFDIKIEPYYEKSSQVKEITNINEIKNIIDNNEIIKLFYKNNKRYNIKNTDNWGNSKGNTYKDVCVVLNKNTYSHYIKNNIKSLPMITRNKLYVACSRSLNNLFIISEETLKCYLK